MFRAVPLPIIRSLFTVHSALVCHSGLKTAGPGWKAVPSWSCSKAVFKPEWHIPVPSVQWINSWWWAEEPPETCRVSCRSKFGKLVHLVGFIIKKYAFVCFDIVYIFFNACIWNIHSAIRKNWNSHSIKNAKMLSLCGPHGVSVFSIFLAVQSDYFPNLHLPVDLCSRGALCCVCGGTWAYKCYLD